MKKAKLYKFSQTLKVYRHYLTRGSAMVKSRTDGAYALVYRTYMVDRRSRDKHGGPSWILLIPASSVRRRNFFKVHSCADKNGSREKNHAPFKGDLSSL